MSYRILFTPSAARALEALPQADRTRLGRRIDALSTNPRPVGVKKLVGHDNLYRLRSGPYRVIYTIEDRVVTVTVVRIGHRRDIYR